MSQLTAEEEDSHHATPSTRAPNRPIASLPQSSAMGLGLPETPAPALAPGAPMAGDRGGGADLRRPAPGAGPLARDGGSDSAPPASASGTGFRSRRPRRGIRGPGSRRAASGPLVLLGDVRSLWRSTGRRPGGRL